MSQEDNETETIARLVKEASQRPELLERGDITILALPLGWTSEEIDTDEYGLKRKPPAYIKSAVALQSVQSLVDYVNRFKGDDTVLFANIDSNSIVAAIDYHGQEHAAHVAHRGALTLPLSLEWKMWAAISGKLLEQLEFARFIEENGADIAVPSGAELLECVRDLQAHRSVSFSKAVRTSSESENFEYSEQTEARSRSGGIDVPTKFKLSIPVYFGEPDTEVFAFLRWKLGDGKLSLGVQLHRAEHVRHAVFKQIVLSVAEETDCTAMFGGIE